MKPERFYDESIREICSGRRKRASNPCPRRLDESDCNSVAACARDNLPNVDTIAGEMPEVVLPWPRLS